MFLGRGGCRKRGVTYPVAEVRLQKIVLDVGLMSSTLMFRAFTEFGTA